MINLASSMTKKSPVKTLFFSVTNTIYHEIHNNAMNDGRLVSDADVSNEFHSFIRLATKNPIIPCDSSNAAISS